VGKIAPLGKRQEILIEAMPGIRRIAALAHSKEAGSLQLQALQDAGRARDVEVSIYRVANAEEITAAIDAAKASGAAALNVLSSPFLYGNRQLISERVAALRLPAIYQWPEEAEEAGFGRTAGEDFSATVRRPRPRPPLDRRGSGSVGGRQVQHEPGCTAMLAPAMPW
jgi:hypothetical protein